MNKATKWTELGTLVESSRRGDVYMGTLMQNTVYGHIEKSMELCFCEPDVCIVIGWMTHFAQQHHWPTFISSREACLFRERKGSFEWKIPYSSAFVFKYSHPYCFMYLFVQWDQKEHAWLLYCRSSQTGRVKGEDQERQSGRHEQAW